ncbi:uncharacterized protein TNCV_2173411 [Trichonephila clavipes]|nr:uncharacterized protein TNCV_2173411 [Trichonephila clavipes]
MDVSRNSILLNCDSRVIMIVSSCLPILITSHSNPDATKDPAMPLLATLYHISDAAPQNACREASPLVWLVEGVERWEAPDPPPGVFPQNWGGNEPNYTITCMVLKATANDRRHLALCHDEFRGPPSGLCRSGGISNNYYCAIRFFLVDLL